MFWTTFRALASRNLARSGQFAEMRAIDPETYSATPNCHDVRPQTLALLQVKTTGKSMRKSAASLMERKYGVNLREVDSSLRWSTLPSPRDSWQEVTPGQFTHNCSACNLIPAPSVPRYRLGTRYQNCFDFGSDSSVWSLIFAERHRPSEMCPASLVRPGPHSELHG
jgi:hypothetical protein